MPQYFQYMPSNGMQYVNGQTGSYINGRVTCSFQRSIIGDNVGIYALNNSYYLLLGFGPANAGKRPSRLFKYIHTHMRTIYTHVHKHMKSFIHTYVHTYIHNYSYNTCAQTYIHTFLQTYIVT